MTTAPGPETSSGTDTQTAIAELADRFFAAIEAGDVAALREIYAPDARIWHNFDQLDQAVEDNLRVLAYLGRTVRDLRYTEVRRVVIDGAFVQQHVLRGQAPGGELAIPAMLRIEVRDGHVTRVEEYLDPAQANVLRG